MKRIYAFTLDGDDYPSSKFRCNLRLIAYLLYDRIYNYDGEGFTALIINEKIKCNNIYEGTKNNEYYFEYNEYNPKYINYEPVILSDNSFALTIDDRIMSEEILRDLMNEILLEVLLLSKINYSYSIKSIGYLSKDFNDERNRKKTLIQLRDSLFEREIVTNKVCYIRKKIIDTSLFGKKVGLF